jgi:hypothetical protein
LEASRAVSSQDIISTNVWLQWSGPVISATCGSTNRRFKDQASLGIKLDPISKITNAERAGRVASVANCLHTKCNALNSIPSTVKKITALGNYIPKKISFIADLSFDI